MAGCELNDDNHQHWWTQDGDRWACEDCGESCPACIECGRWTASALLICERCVRRVARIIDDIEVSIRLHSPMPRSVVPAIRYDRDRITGDRITGDRASGGGGLSFTEAKAVLESWADYWAETIGQARSIGAADYLRGHVLWAAHNAADSDWAQWLVEMRQVRAVTMREAGVAPKRLPAPCAHCGGMAVQDWADARLTPYRDGLSDEVRCTGCGLTWRSREQFMQLSKQHLRSLPEVMPEMLVTITEARAIWPDVPLATWRKWRERGEIPDAGGWDVRGEPVYPVGGLAQLVVRRKRARGRRAG